MRMPLIYDDFEYIKNMIGYIKFFKLNFIIFLKFHEFRISK